MKNEAERDTEVSALLQQLRHCAPRDEGQAGRARAAFLAAADQIAARVSDRPASRLNRWQSTFGSLRCSMRKEKVRMLNLATMLALLLVAVFGGGATMVAAAQSAQPEDVLYPVKTWSEDLRMGLTSNTQDKLELQLQYSARRMDEVQHGLATGTGVSSLLLTRYQNQLQEQLRLVVGLPDELAAAGLAQIRTHAREQEQAMAQLQLQDPAASQIRDSVRMMLRTQEQLAQTGMNDPDWLRQQIRMRSRIRLAAPTAQETPATQTAVDSGNPWTTAVPTPGSSYGPGTSQNPWTDTTPTPESGYGPGPGTKGCPNCPGPSGNGGSSAQPGSAGNNGP